MKYLSSLDWKLAEKQGNITEAAKLIMDEIRYNISRIPHNPIAFETILSQYLSFYYILALSKVPRNIFHELKQTRKDIKQAFSKIAPPLS